MRKLYLLFSCVLAFCITSKLMSAPLSGEYLVGPTGFFASPEDAISSLDTNGVSGPVIMKIQSGMFASRLDVVHHITGSSLINTITLIAADGPGTVHFTGSPVAMKLNSGNFVFKNLVFGNVVLDGFCSNIEFIENDFSDHAIEQFDGTFFDLRILNNTNIGAVLISLRGLIGDQLNINGNIFSDSTGYIDLTSVINVSIIRNRLASIYNSLCSHINIYKNRIIARQDSAYAINVRNCDTGMVANNFVTAYSPTHENLFRNNKALRIYHNTMISEGTADTTLSVRGDSGSSVFNNIIINRNGGYAVKYSGLVNFHADYNNYYNGGFPDLIHHDGSSYSSPAAFFTATGLDEHSVSHNAQLMSFTDLHLQSSESGNEILACLPLPEVPDDYDGEIRGAYPYMGADEIEGFLPVELASFISLVNGNNVTLKWTTSSETNNRGFEIERSSVINGVENNWTRIGYLAGSGTTNSYNEYSYSDNGLERGKYSYRIKQMDFNGTYRYYYLSNDAVIGSPASYTLSQNYPNPFNPVTTINYELPADGNVVLKIYDITGKEVMTLINEMKTAGYYSVAFNAGGLSSGQYFYEIVSGDFRQIRKMVLIK